MATQIFNINIEGYWREKNKEGIPNQSGVYFVYEAIYNNVNDTVTLLHLIYIGEAEDVRQRIKTHTKYDQWLLNIKHGNELCYSTGYIEESQRERNHVRFFARGTGMGAAISQPRFRGCLSSTVPRQGPIYVVDLPVRSPPARHRLAARLLPCLRETSPARQGCRHS